MDVFIVITTIIMLGLMGWQVWIMKQQTPQAPSSTSSLQGKKFKYWPIIAMAILVLINWAPYLYQKMTTTPTFWEPDQRKLEPIIMQSFSNQEIILDGKHFDECTFKNVTLVYEGKKPFVLSHNKFDLGGNQMTVKIADGPQFASAGLIKGIMEDLCKSANANCRYIRLVTANNEE